VLETVGSVFYHDALAREQNMRPEDRLLFHQQKSLPLMEGLQDGCRQQIDGRKAEPKSGLGKAVSYLLRTGQN
jgi:transposase